MRKDSGIRARILFVDDDDAFRDALSDALRQSGFDVSEARSAEEALRKIDDDGSYDVALVDLRLPGISGEELVREIHQLAPSTEVIVLTGHATVESAVRTLKEGAYDFLSKPCSLDELETALRRAQEKRALVRENRFLQRELDRHVRFREFVGTSPPLRAVLEIISKVSQTDSTVLVQGESGVGKELAAHAIHAHSPRRSQPFIVVDCTSLQESLLQSELFGHERGAFTGAVARKHGLFEVASGGTIFLDEIGEISMPLQSRILRVLDSGSFRRVGGVRDVRVDVRVICATNRNLDDMVKQGRFRQDLYYRVNVVSFTLPPLRERREDIPLLARYFAESSPVARRRPARFSSDVLSALQAYSWPGNVRELHNVVERALILADGDGEVRLDDLPVNLRQEGSSAIQELTAQRPSLAELENVYIQRLLVELGGHRARVAEVLGISERTLYRKLKRRSRPAGRPRT
jgi:two-component system response regulator AtoC